MTIALPLLLPAQNVALAEVRSVAHDAVVQFRAYRLHLPVTAQLSPDMVKNVIAGCGPIASVDDAVQELAQAYYDAGILSAQLIYAVVDSDVYIDIRERPIVAIQAPASLMPYFASLDGEPPLSDREFEPRRALANVYADRVGMDAQTTLVAVDEGYVLQIEQQQIDPDANGLRAELSNPGNRFVGRNFFDLALRHNSEDGQQLKLLWHAALSGLSNGDATRYNEETLSWSRVTPYGVFDLSGHAFDYVQKDDIHGRLRETQVHWLYPLAAGLRSRWLVDAAADYLDQQHDGNAAQNFVNQQERYPSLQLGSHFSYSTIWNRQPVDIDLGMTVRKGLRSDVAVTGAELDYLLVRPTLNLNAELGEAFDAGLAVAAQLSSDRLPEEAQWVLGGVDNIAAYLPGIAIGDSGGYGAVDLQYSGWQLAAMRLLPRLFVEYGISKAKGSSSIQQLSDLGIQLGASWRYLEASLTAAFALNQHGIAEQTRHESESNLLFRLTARF